MATGAAAIGLGTAALVGGIAAAGHITSGVINSSAQKSVAQTNLQAQQATNEANKQMTDATNATNIELWERQNAQQWKMWEAEKNYNSAPEQAKRLSAAGINPQLAMSGANAGTASSMTAPSAPQLTPPQFQAPQLQYTTPALSQIFSALGDMPGQAISFADQIATAQQNQTKAVVDAATSNYKIQQQLYELKQAYENSHKSYHERMIAYSEYKYLNTFLNNRNIGMELQNNLYRAQERNVIANTAKTYAEADSVKLQNYFERVNMPVKIDTAKAMLEQIYKSTALAVAQKEMTYAETKSYIQQALKTAAETYGIKLNNTQFEKLSPFVVQETRTALLTSMQTLGNESNYQRHLSKALSGDNWYSLGTLYRNGRMLKESNSLGFGSLPKLSFMKVK